MKILAIAILALIGVVSILDLALVGLIALRIYNLRSPASTKLSPAEEEIRLAARKKFEEEQKAFEEVMNYSADIAYGIKQEDF